MSSVVKTFKGLAKGIEKTAEWGGDVVESGYKDAIGEGGESPDEKMKREAKEAGEKEIATQKAKQDELIAAGEKRKKQVGAEKAATKSLSTAKNRQSRKSSSGRKSTLLTDTLGGTSGETEETLGKKSLLGL